MISSLTEELKKEVKPGVSTLPESLYVKNAQLDRNNNLLTVDLSSDYYDNIKNLGSGPEDGESFTVNYDNIKDYLKPLE